jgi:tripartite-type tricarboxylate transporter receptor subunit TctC
LRDRLARRAGNTAKTPQKRCQQHQETSMETKLTRRALIATGAAAGLAGLSSGTARAQAWPARPVTLVVPYGPGASNDTFTRALAEILTRKFNKPFVVENRPGAGGFSGTHQVSRAAPDGYTFLEMPNSIAGFAPGMKVDFNPLVNLTPVGMLCRAPTALVVNAKLPITTCQEFIDYCKANPTTAYYGYAGTGTAQHQHMEMFCQSTGIRPKGVNYKSSADAQTDLIAGRLQAMIITVASTIGQINAGQLRLIAYTNDSFPPSSPKAPTMAEAGVKGMEKAQSFWGIYAPPAMPPEILKGMNEAINDAIKDPGFVALLEKSGASPAPSTPASFAEELRQEIVLITEFFANMPK